MTDQRDRVARAIASASGAQKWQHLVRLQKEEYLAMADAAIAAMDEPAPVSVQEASKIAERIERFGVDHDRSLSGWGLPDNSLVVFRGGNITCYLPPYALSQKEATHERFEI